MEPCSHDSPPKGEVTLMVGTGGKFSDPGVPPMAGLSAQLLPISLSRTGSSSEQVNPLPAAPVGHGATFRNGTKSALILPRL